LKAARDELAAARTSVTSEDRYQVDALLGAQAWTIGDGPAALAAFDSVLAYQSDNPDGLRGRANALALSGRADEAFKLYDDAVRVRTGVVELRNDFARDLLFAGRVKEAKAQLDEAHLIDEENPTSEALRGWAALASRDVEGAKAHVRQALAWGSWSDLAMIVQGGILAQSGNMTGAEKAWAIVRERIAKKLPPEWVYRPKLATWEETHTLPAVERQLLDRFANAAKGAMSTQ
jgi:tetratricopeptide (TPR) repeat protein